MNLDPQKKKAIKLPKPVFVLEILLWLEFICAMFLKCFYFQFTTKLNTKPYFNTFNCVMLLGVLTSVLFITAFLIISFNMKRLIGLFIINIMISSLLFADTVYYRYYYCALSVPVLYQLGLVGSLKESIKSLLSLNDFLFAADIPVLLAFLILFRHTLKMKLEKRHILKRLISAAIVFALGFGLFQYAYSQASSGIFPYDNNYVVNNLGVFYFHYYDIKKYAKENLFVDRHLTNTEKSNIAAFFNSKTQTGDKYKGIAKGKNLIILQVEAMQNFVINKKLDGKEITPNLNKFINDSAYFDNFYYQTGGGNTADAEFLSNTSLYPMQEGAVYFRFPSNTYESTAKILKKQGYMTYVAHANNPSFWNRAEVYKALGYDKFLSSKSFVTDEYLGWGLGDKSFFKQTLEKLDTSKPFYSFLISLSSHYPFNYFEHYYSFNVGNYENTFLGNYLKSMNYVDDAIGQFLEDLKERGLYENSVIVIYGDHSAVPKDRAEVLKDFLNYKDSPYNWLKLQKTPCFIRFPGIDNKGVQKTVVGEIDILPTIANLLGVEAPHAMGKDMFNTDKGYAVLRNSSVITDDFLYDNSSGKLFDYNGNELDKAAYEAAIKKYQDQLLISDEIIKKNALSPDNLK